MSVVTREEMIAALDCGRRFYASAAERVERGDLKLLFQDIAYFKSAMLDDLMTSGDADREATSTPAWATKLERVYVGIEANWDSDHAEHRYLPSLVKSEDQVLHAFGSAVVHSDDPLVREVARKHLEEVIHTHRRLLRLRFERSG